MTKGTYFQKLLTACLLCIAASTATLKANTTQALTKNCVKMAKFGGLVDVAGMILYNPTLVSKTVYRTFILQVSKQDLEPVIEAIRASGRGNVANDLNAYVAMLDSFASKRVLFGDKRARELIEHSDFILLQSRMELLTAEICNTNAMFEETAITSSTGATGNVGNSVAERGSGSTLSHIVQAAGSLPTTGNWVPTQDAKNLGNLFSVLGVAVFVAILTWFGIKIFRAYRLSRYSVEIPVNMCLNNIVFDGMIDIIGRRGISFRVEDGYTATDLSAFELGARAQFLMEGHSFVAELTKDFDGTAGFRLVKPFSRQELPHMLTYSQIPPKRILNLKTRKRKTAHPLMGYAAKIFKPA